jgi:3D (Asp-Asp-Asp) domain-containing protein
MAKNQNPAKSNPLKRYFEAVKGALNRLKSAFKKRNIISLALITGFSFGFLPVFEPVKQANADLTTPEVEQSFLILMNGLRILQGNSILPVSPAANPNSPVFQKVRVVVTAYSSTPWQTDDTPEITASGKRVKDGIVANNMLPFGTKIRMPELYGNQVFTVEDRMNQVKGNYHVDIWFPSYSEAKNFGAKMTYIEILGS